MMKVKGPRHRVANDNLHEDRYKEVRQLIFQQRKNLWMKFNVFPTFTVMVASELWVNLICLLTPFPCSTCQSTLDYLAGGSSHIPQPSLLPILQHPVALLPIHLVSIQTTLPHQPTSHIQSYGHQTNLPVGACVNRSVVASSTLSVATSVRLKIIL